MLDPKAVADAGVPAGAALLAFVNAAHGDGDLPASRQALEAAVGSEGVIEAAATVAAFNGLVRVADGTGIQLDDGVFADSADFREAAGINEFGGADNSAGVSPAGTVDRQRVRDLFA
ncbi:MAG: hypothetical protein AAFN30_02400 [Actinomycetota bacterium]